MAVLTSRVDLRFYHLFVAILIFYWCKGITAETEAAVARLENQSLTDVDVYWRNVNSGDYRLVANIPKGGGSKLNTFVGHEFLILPKEEKALATEPPNFIQRQTFHQLIISGPEENELKKLVLTESPIQLKSEQSQLLINQNDISNEAAIFCTNTLNFTVATYGRSNNGSYVKLLDLAAGKEGILNTFTGHDLLFIREGGGGMKLDHLPSYRVQVDVQHLRLTKTKDLGEEDTGTVMVEIEEGESNRLSSLMQGKPTLQVLEEVVQKCHGMPRCISNLVYKNYVKELLKQISSEITIRDDLEEPYRDYVCLHHQQMLPEDFVQDTWVYKPPSGLSVSQKAREIQVDKYFVSERENARIYLLHDMVSQEECQALRERSQGRLANAVVTGDSSGEKIVSKARKAKAALVKPNLDDEKDILGDLKRRIFAFVNDVKGAGGYENFTLAGQEPFNVIKYNESGDEYKVHCDGYCDSSTFVDGGRAATVVLFCEEAARGGQTSFSNADILVKGRPGQAVFFHYRDKDGIMDSGWTKHSGCPVLEGTKWIATQWIRDGVSDEDPWYRYSPTGDLDNEELNYKDPNY